MPPKVKKSFQPKKPEETFPDKVADNAEDIARAITMISNGMKALNESRLRPKAVLLLISHSAKVPQRTVENVLNALTSLEKTYLK